MWIDWHSGCQSQAVTMLTSSIPAVATRSSVVRIWVVTLLTQSWPKVKAPIFDLTRHTTIRCVLCVVYLVDRRVLHVGTSTRWAGFFYFFPARKLIPPFLLTVYDKVARSNVSEMAFYQLYEKECKDAERMTQRVSAGSAYPRCIFSAGQPIRDVSSQLLLGLW